MLGAVEGNSKLLAAMAQSGAARHDRTRLQLHARKLDKYLSSSEIKSGRGWFENKRHHRILFSLQLGLICVD